MEAEMDVRKLREQVVLTSSPSGRVSQSGEIRFSNGGGGGGGRAASLDMDGAADSTYSGGGGGGGGGSGGSGGNHDSGGAEVGCCNLKARNPRVEKSAWFHFRITNKI